MLLGPQTTLAQKTIDSRPWEQHFQICVGTSKLQVRSGMNLSRFMANNGNGDGASKTNAVQGRVNLWIEFVNRNIYSSSVFGCWQRAFAGLECSQGGAYLHCNSNEFRAGVVVLGAQEGFGPWWESSRLPGIDLVGRKSLPARWGVGGTEEIQGK